MKTPRKKIKKTSTLPPLLLFLAFTIIALLTVMALEYIDWQSGRPSFIFSHIFKPKAASEQQEKFHRSLLQSLEADHHSYQFLKDSSGVFHFNISLAAGQLAGLAAQIGQEAGHCNGKLELIDSQKEKALFLYQVTFAKRVGYMLLVSVEEAAIKPLLTDKKPSAGPARAAIIIDDVGYTETVADQLHNLGIPITAAIIPEAPFAVSQAMKLHGFGLEEIIHLPMESMNAQNHNMESDVITTTSTAEEIAERIRKARKIVPFASGINNHMGSLITSRREWIEKVLLEVRRANLFFIDSRTSPDSIAYEVAKELGIKTFSREIFLDGIQDYNHSRGQIRLLVSQAKARGETLAIGHPFDTTLKALRDSLAWLKSQNVEFVFVSRLVK